MDDHFALRMFLGQLPLLYVIGKVFEKRLDGKDRKLENEANRMAGKITENAALVRRVPGKRTVGHVVVRSVLGVTLSSVVRLR
jgi:hypothetical protein